MGLKHPLYRTELVLIFYYYNLLLYYMANGVWFLSVRKKEIIFKKYPNQRFRKSIKKKIKKNG